jgi:RNA methyltransferase, TrmH family
VVTRAEERLVRSLHGRRRGRRGEDLFLAEGVRVVEELLAAGLSPRLAVASTSLEDTGRGRGLAARLAAVTTVRAVSPAHLDRLAATTTPQGVLVVAEVPRVDLARIQPGPVTTALVLDGVQDPGNIGTLARTAAAFGCALLVCLPGTVDPWSPKAVRAAAGAVFRLPVVVAPGDDVWRWLEGNRFAVLGADAAGVPVTAEAVPACAALVVGNEGAGLTAAARARCERLVAVPMLGTVESLNVAVAAGILLYELTRGRV